MLKEVDKNLSKIIQSTLKLAEKNIKTVMPGLTHLKNAQPLSLGHYLLAYVEMFSRDKKRLKFSSIMDSSFNLFLLCIFQTLYFTRNDQFFIGWDD